MKRILLLLSIFLILAGYTKAQQIKLMLPDTTFTQNNVSVRIPVIVKYFNNIGAVSLVINYDPNVLTFTGTDSNPDHGTFVPPTASNGHLYLSWYDTNPLNIGNSAFTILHFTYNQGTTSLDFQTSSCEIADNAANPINVTYVNGNVSGPSSSLLSLGGNVWIDSNNDGLLNSGEKGLQWVTVSLYKGDGTWLNWTLTDSLGNYAFNNLNPGTYYCEYSLIDANDIYKFTTKGVGSNSAINSSVSQLNDSTGKSDPVDLSGSNYMTLNAGVILKSGSPSNEYAEIDGNVWQSTDPNNGIMRAGDPGIGNVKVKLLESNYTVLDSTYSNSSGYYAFTNLSAGNYRVQFVLLNNYIFVASHQGSDPSVYSDPDPGTGITVTHTLTTGENLIVNAGMYQNCQCSEPNLWITKDDGRILAPTSGNTTTYKIQYGNNGTGNLYNAAVIDTLPVGMSYVSSTKGSETSGGSGIVVYNLGTLYSNTSGEIDLTVKVTASESQYLNIAYLNGKDSDSRTMCVSASDLDVKDSTSNCDHSGVESRGDMAEFLLKRLLKIQYGMTTPILKNKGAKALTSLYSLQDLIPQTGPYNSKAVSATPFDILGISNAISSYAVNYDALSGTNDTRIGGIFSTVTAAPSIYDHLKAVCDRLAGYQVDDINLININGYQFYGAKLVKQTEGITDYAISFSVYETPSGYKVQNKWTYEEYQAPQGASSVYNFQVWANSYDAASQLVQKIISKFQAHASVTYMNTNQISPDVFIKSAYYTHDGEIHLVISNITKTAKQVSISNAFRISQGDNPLTNSSSYTINPGINDITVNSGIISDANLYMSQQNGFADEVYVSGGAYTYINGPNSNVTTFKTGGYPQELRSNFPDGSLILSGGAYVSGQLSDWASVVRSLNAEGAAYDLSNYGSLRFTASGTGTVEVIFNLTDTKNYNYFTYKINLTNQSKVYNINFDQLKLLYGGSQKFDPKLVEDIGFIINTTDNPGLSNFSFEVKNIAFIGNDISNVNTLNTVPKEFALNQNYPNPFNPSTVIEFSVPKQEKLMLTVYNVLGQKVATLLNAEETPGIHSITFDGSNLSSGIYFYQLTGDNVNITKKMILAK